MFKQFSEEFGTVFSKEKNKVVKGEKKWLHLYACEDLDEKYFTIAADIVKKLIFE